MPDLDHAIFLGREAFVSAPLGVSAVAYAIGTAAPHIESAALLHAAELLEAMTLPDPQSEWGVGQRQGLQMAAGALRNAAAVAKTGGAW